MYAYMQGGNLIIKYVKVSCFLLSKQVTFPLSTTTCKLRSCIFLIFLYEQFFFFLLLVILALFFLQAFLDTAAETIVVKSNLYGSHSPGWRSVLPGHGVHTLEHYGRCLRQCLKPRVSHLVLPLTLDLSTCASSLVWFSAACICQWASSLLLHFIFKTPKHFICLIDVHDGTEWKCSIFFKSDCYMCNRYLFLLLFIFWYCNLTTVFPQTLPYCHPFCTLISRRHFLLSVITYIYDFVYTYILLNMTYVHMMFLCMFFFRTFPFSLYSNRSFLGRTSSPFPDFLRSL